MPTSLPPASCARRGRSPFDLFLGRPAMRAVFDAPSLVQAMLDVEAALALAQADCGVVPPECAAAIADTCQVEHIDIDALIADGQRAGTLVIPLVRQLTAAVARHAPQAAGHVHLGSTSQDILDTAMVLVTRRALALIESDLTQLSQALLAHARRHLDTPVLARTLMQPAQVTSLGLKLLGWTAPLLRSSRRLSEAATSALQLQLGGAVGTLSTMGPQGEAGPAVVRRMASRLALAEPVSPWHTQRDDWVTLAAMVGVLSGSLSKIATDLSLMSQGEIGELAEPGAGGRGGSSAMPHKRNPVASMLALANGLRAPHRVAALLTAMAQQHERGLGNWQAELAEWGELFIEVHGALAALAEVAGGLVIDAPRMRRNIDGLQGLVFAEGLTVALTPSLGKAAAFARVEVMSREAISTGQPLHQVAGQHRANDALFASALSEDGLAAVFDLQRAVVPAAAMARRLLAALPGERADSATT